jgi:hypothetical protein
VELLAAHHNMSQSPLAAVNGLLGKRAWSRSSEWKCLLSSYYRRTCVIRTTVANAFGIAARSCSRGREKASLSNSQRHAAFVISAKDTCRR